MTQDSQDDRRCVLVTGANGFLGSEIVRQAADARVRVRATGRSGAPLVSGMDYWRADILDPESLRPAIDGIESVIHAAGLAHVFDRSQAEDAPFQAVNATGTANVARTAAQAGVQQFVLISSVAVYGDDVSARDEKLVCRPEGPYAKSKWEAEQRAIEIAEASGMRLTILRLATVYGEGDPGNVARLMRAIDRGCFVWVGDGSNRKSLIHREDAARACMSVLNTSEAGINTYNVSAPPCTVRDVVEGLASALGRSLPRWHVPAYLALWLARIGGLLTRGHGRLGNLNPTLKKWLADDVYVASKFRQRFDFQTHVELAEGLRQEVAWYRTLVPGRIPNCKVHGDHERY